MATTRTTVTVEESQPINVVIGNTTSPGTFDRLRDTPASKSGQALKVVRVNAAEDALEYAEDAGGITDHALLSNLDYASAGHTGFASSEDLEALDLQAVTDVGAITNNDISIAKDGNIRITVGDIGGTHNYISMVSNTAGSFLGFDSLYAQQTFHWDGTDMSFTGEYDGFTDFEKFKFKNVQVQITDADLDMDTNKVINVVDPTDDQDAATKKYVDDNAGAGLWEFDGSSTILTTPTDVNLQLNQLKEAIMDRVDTLPTATEGRVVYLNTDDHLYLGIA